MARWAIDIAVLATALGIAYLLRFDSLPSATHRTQFLIVVPSVVALKILALQLTRAAQRTWRYFSFQDAVSVSIAMVAASMMLLIVRLLAGAAPPAGWAGVWRIPVGVLAMDLILATSGLLVVRAARRLTSERTQAKYREGSRSREPVRTVLIGAGQAGGMVVRELRARPDLGDC